MSNTTDAVADVRARALTPEEQAKLQELNEAVDHAALQRATFLKVLQEKYKGARLLPDGRLRWVQSVSVAVPEDRA
jgi:hypothetical protein